MAWRRGHFASLLRLLVAVLLGLTSQTARPAEVYDADAVKAAFLIRFTGYVDWPPEALARPVFTIAVLAAEPVGAELTRLLRDRPVKNLPAQVRVVHSPEDASGAQVLYVGSAYTGSVPALAAALGKQPVLLVTDSDGGLDVGGTVNFRVFDSRVRFEISLAAAAQAHLKIAPELLSVAVHVQGAEHTDSVCLWPRDLLCARQVAFR